MFVSWIPGAFRAPYCGCFPSVLLHRFWQQAPREVEQQSEKNDQINNRVAEIVKRSQAEAGVTVVDPTYNVAQVPGTAGEGTRHTGTLEVLIGEKKFNIDNPVIAQSKKLVKQEIRNSYSAPRDKAEQVHLPMYTYMYIRACRRAGACRAPSCFWSATSPRAMTAYGHNLHGLLFDS